MSKEQELVEITAQQYRQLDFLRLFRLCRNLGLFNRKRKMPTEYNSDDANKNDKNARSACRRLLRGLVVHIFPDGYTVKSNFNNYFVEFPPEMRNALSYINSKVHELERSEDPEYREAAAGYRLLVRQINGFIYPRMPYSVKVHFSAENRRRYRDVRRMAMGGGGSDFVHKPPESFYQCAVACLEYKEIWDKYGLLMVKVADRHKVEGDKKRKPLRAERIVEVVANASVQTANADSLRRLAEAVGHSAESGPRNTQESFNRALENLRSRRGNQ